MGFRNFLCASVLLVHVSPFISSAQVPPAPAPAETPEAESSDKEPAASAEPVPDGVNGSAVNEPADRSADEPIPVLPETRVVAEPFPRAPLAEGTVLSATRTEAALGQVGSAITVLNEQDIARSGQPSLLEVLRNVPGLDFAARGPGRTTSGFLRGANSEHTKVLLDGIPLNDPTASSRGFDFSFFTIDNIERIEVLRGPQSTLYGSDAIGGVVNIITKRGSGPPLLSTRAMGGSFDTYYQTGSISGGTESVYYSFGGSFFDTNGFSAVSERFGATEKDGFRNGTLSGRAGWIVDEHLDLDFVFRYTDADADIDGFDPVTFLPADDFLDNRTEAFFMRTQARLSLWDDALENKFAYNFAKYHRDAAGGFAEFFDGETRKFEWQANLLTHDGTCFRNIVTGGIEYLHEEGVIDSFPDPFQSAQFDDSYLAQDQVILWDRVFTTIGVRWDDYSNAGQAFTYRTTARVLAPETDTAVHGSLGTGFRSPSLFQMFDPSFGNSSLRPEESKGWDVGVEQQLAEGRLVVDATYFRNDFNNLIDFVFPSGFLNVNQALATGVELTGRFDVREGTFLTAAYTRTDSRDRETGAELLLRPRDKVSLGINQSVFDGRGDVNFTLRWVDARNDFGPVRLHDYTVAYLSFSYDVDENVQLFARWDNMFDEDYEEAFGFATAGSSAYGGVMVTLGGSADRRSTSGRATRFTSYGGQ